MIKVITGVLNPQIIYSNGVDLCTLNSSITGKIYNSNVINDQFALRAALIKAKPVKLHIFITQPDGSLYHAYSSKLNLEIQQEHFLTKEDGEKLYIKAMKMSVFNGSLHLSSINKDVSLVGILV